MTKEEKRVYNAAYHVAHKEKRREYDAAHYADHREEVSIYNKAYHEAHEEELREKSARKQTWFTANLNILKAAQGCGDCGTHGGLLDHHHVDPSTKKYKVSEMCGFSTEKFLDEIAKCTVLCRPCHLSSHVEMRALAA